MTKNGETKMTESEINPIIRSDYPDPDVVRVGDTYYMVSTTMHFMPGGVILRSYDLAHWEIVSYIFDKLDETAEERLEREQTNYGRGMWAPCIRYHEGVFYVVFVSHGTKTTYLFTSKSPEGPWEKKIIEGYYHDCSLLFDDGKVYVAHGNREIHLTQLKEDLSGPKPGGIDRVIVKEPDDFPGWLGYEGSHIYKINGEYYVFLIHWPANDMRTECCFVADTIEGDFKGGDVLRDARGFFGNGVAQGGIVDTPNGRWFSVMFQDSGAVGRMPILVPIKWENDFPVFGSNGKIPKQFEISSSRPYYRYEPVYTSDTFEGSAETRHPSLKLQWQWNHCPDDNLWEIRPEGGLKIRSGKICSNLTYAVNTLTQRMMWPKCEAEVTIDASGLKEGDVAGMCALQGDYGYLGITMTAGVYYLIKVVHKTENAPKGLMTPGDYLPGTVADKIRLSSSCVTVCLKPSFEGMADKLDFFYLKDGRMARVGNSHKLCFRLDHFTGCRFGLFMFSTREVGGEAVFTDFKYRYE